MPRGPSGRPIGEPSQSPSQPATGGVSRCVRIRGGGGGIARRLSRSCGYCCSSCGWSEMTPSRRFGRQCVIPPPISLSLLVSTRRRRHCCCHGHFVFRVLHSFPSFLSFYGHFPLRGGGGGRKGGGVVVSSTPS